MRRTRVRFTITAAAIAGLVTATQALALGLGEINVSSNLNQRFAATIPLTEISSEDLETVTVSIAPNEAFERAGIERSDYLASLDFEIKNDNGRPRVVVSSSQIAREPVVDLLVQARWSGGKIARSYTILLDPPEIMAASPQPPVAKPVATADYSPAAATPTAAPIIATPAPVAAKPSAPQSAEFYQTPTETKPALKTAIKPPPAATTTASNKAETGRYGPVTKGETLWSIAKQVRPSSAISMDEVMLALAEANPKTILRGTTVSKGATLQVPSAQQMLRYPPAETKARLAALRGGSAMRKPQPIEKPVLSSAVVEPAKSSAAFEAVTKPEPAAAASATPVTPVATLPADAAAPAATPSTAATAPEPAVAAAPDSATPVAAPEAAVATEPAVPTEPAAVPAPAEEALAPAKSPLAQPLSEPEGPGLFEKYGALIMAAMLLLLLLIGAVMFSRRRKTAVATPTSGKPFETFSAADVVSDKTPTVAVGATGRFGDASRASKAASSSEATAAMPAKASTPAPKAEAAAAPVAAPAPASAAAAFALDPEMTAILDKALSSTPAVDKTPPLHMETLQINLGDNDPLSEADFHLAYGLYDEAILLLQAATAKQPDRMELKVKLAETYFAAGRSMEFQELAEDLQPHLSASEWGKIAIMGTQLCPDVSLFKNSAGSVGLDTDFDLDFGEPAAPATDSSVNFSLTEPKLSLTLDEPASVAAKPAASTADDGSIDFMLSQSLTPLGAAPVPANTSKPSFNLDTPSLEVGMPDLTLSPPGSYSNRNTIAPGLSLQTLENSLTQARSGGGNAEDEANTKLDLARAYVEMGDNDMARSLLQEVQKQGGERQKQEATALLLRLPA